MKAIEKIRAEIQRMLDDIVSNNYDCHSITVLDDVLSFIDTLQESDDADLDTEIYLWLRDHGSEDTARVIAMTARHFYNLGKSER